MKRILLIIALLAQSSYVISEPAFARFATAVEQCGKKAIADAQLESGRIDELKAFDVREIARFRKDKKELLDNARQALMIAKNLESDSSGVAEPVKVAALLKCSVSLTKLIEQMLFASIEVMDRAIDFWEYEKADYAKPQLRSLYDAQESYCATAGNLYQQCVSFDEQMPDDEKRAWIGQLISNIRTIAGGTYVQPVWHASVSALIPQLEDAIERIEQYKAEKTMASVGHVPSHVRRYWKRYAVGGIVTAGVIGAMAAKGGRILESARSFKPAFTRYFITPFKSITGLLKEDEESKKAVSDYYRTVMGRHGHLLHIDASSADKDLEEAIKNIDWSFIEKKTAPLKGWDNLTIYNPLTWNTAIMEYKSLLPRLGILWAKIHWHKIKESEWKFIFAGARLAGATLGWIFLLTVAKRVATLSNRFYNFVRNPNEIYIVRPVARDFGDLVRLLVKYNGRHDLMSAHDKGRMAYLAFKLTTRKYALTETDRRRFVADVDALLSLQAEPGNERGYIAQLRQYLRTMDREFAFLSVKEIAREMQDPRHPVGEKPMGLIKNVLMLPARLINGVTGTYGFVVKSI